MQLDSLVSKVTSSSFRRNLKHSKWICICSCIFIGVLGISAWAYLFVVTAIVADEGRVLDFLGLISQRYSHYGFQFMPFL